MHRLIFIIATLAAATAAAAAATTAADELKPLTGPYTAYLRAMELRIQRDKAEVAARSYNPQSTEILTSEQQQQQPERNWRHDRRDKYDAIQRNRVAANRARAAAAAAAVVSAKLRANRTITCYKGNAECLRITGFTVSGKKPGN